MRSQRRAHERFDSALERCAGFLVSSDDQDGVVPRDGARDFRKFRSVHGGGQGLSAARRRLEDEKIFRWTNIEEKFAEGSRQRRHRSGLFGQGCGLLVAIARFDEFELLQIAREGGLGDAEALLCEAPAEFFLIANVLATDEAKDLSVAKCFSESHKNAAKSPLYFYTFRCIFLSNGFLHFLGRGAPGRLCTMRTISSLCSGFSRRDEVTYSTAKKVHMATQCKAPGCKGTAPPALEEQQLCVLHYTLALEGTCGEMRRETALGNAPQDRQREIMKFLTESGERLARVATSGLPLTDDLKARILSTFLTLMNLRENLDRASMRTSHGRGVLR